MPPIREVGLAAAMALTAALFAAPAVALDDINDCSPGAMEELRRRIFASPSGDDAERPLKPIVFARDVLHLQACGNGSPNSPGAIVERRLSEQHDIERRAISDRSVLGELPGAAAACAHENECEVYRRKDYQTPQVFGLAKSGGLPLAMFLGHLGKEGHYEITGRALNAMKRPGFAWSPRAAEIMQDASRDADFYEWGNPAAHAQTRNSDADGKIIQKEAEAQKAFESWVRDYLGKARAACTAGRTREALYLLGYALHALQDLVFHEGITNAEHSFRDFVEGLKIDSRHRYDEKMRLAERATVAALEHFAAGLGGQSAACWTHMAGWQGAGALDSSEKQAVLRIGKKDFTLGAYFEYEKLSRVVRSSLLSKGKEPDFFIRPHWLDQGKEARLMHFISRIFE